MSEYITSQHFSYQLYTPESISVTFYDGYTNRVDYAYCYVCGKEVEINESTICKKDKSDNKHEFFQIKVRFYCCDLCRLIGEL